MIYLRNGIRAVVHFKKEPYDVYIGRPSIFGNPWSHLENTQAEFKAKNRLEAVENFRDWLKGERFTEVLQNKRKIILDNLPKLKGKILGCWCGNQLCHGDPLAQLADEVQEMASEIAPVTGFNEYQNRITETAVYNRRGEQSVYAIDFCSTGLTEEAGEISGHVKRILRGDDNHLYDTDDPRAIKPSEERRKKIIIEAGDVLWYLARLATELGTTLEEIAYENLKKIQRRKENDSFHGHGDDR